MARKREAKVTQNDVTDTFKMCLVAKNLEQKEMLRTIAKSEITFVKGAPGTGKSYLAVAWSLRELLKGNYDKIVFTRPVVEAGGERLGFLPGDLHEKIDPYMIPLFDAMSQLLPEEVFKKMTVARGPTAQVQVLPLAYMRGVTFRNCIVVCDEMQNSTPEQIRMLLTRLGENARIIITGDVKQSDITHKNGLQDAFDLLQDIEGIGFVTLTAQAIVRHPIIERIEARYDEREKQLEADDKRYNEHYRRRNEEH